MFNGLLTLIVIKPTILVREHTKEAKVLLYFLQDILWYYQNCCYFIEHYWFFRMFYFLFAFVSIKWTRNWPFYSENKLIGKHWKHLGCLLHNSFHMDPKYQSTTNICIDKKLKLPVGFHYDNALCLVCVYFWTFIVLLHIAIFY